MVYLIAGLGNPGARYEHTRHNAGFEAVDRLAERMGIRLEERKHRALCGKGVLAGQKAVLLKPQTFMNLSGESIREAADFYKTEPDRIIVLYDDVALDGGQLRVRARGSAGGHNGMKSVIACLRTHEFPRVRIGTGPRPERVDLADYVLGCFAAGERERMEAAFREAAEAAEMIVSLGVESAMNRFNGRKGNPHEANVCGSAE